MMLILTRKPGESIQIGDNIKINILDYINNQVKIGIDAPADIEIRQEAIKEKMRAEEQTGNRDI